MKTGLAVASLLLVGVAAAHSYLGERYILIRLFRREDLPPLLGSDRFTKRTLRFAWHLTSVAWVGFAGVLAALALPGQSSSPAVLGITAATLWLTAAVIALASKGRHLAWPVFLVVGLLAWLAR